MAVFWFGWGKKLKNALTKKQADGLYLPKTLETEINELKRLTTIKSYNSTNKFSNGNVSIRNNGYDLSRQLYVSFRKIDRNNVALWDYGFVVYLPSNAETVDLTDNVSIGFSSSMIVFVISNLTNGEQITNISLKGTPSTLTTFVKPTITFKNN